jgi:cyclopropane-fatty-acyl-phospholipid synthase
MLLDKLLKRLIRSGELTVTWPDGKITHYGTPAPGRAPVLLAITSNAASRRIATNPMLAAGEEFMSGGLKVPGEDIFPLLDLISHNMRWEWGNRTRQLISNGQRWLSGLTQLNDAVRSKKNVAHHYDLSDRLYDLFLDADRQYSCAYFTERDNSLEQAQADKKAHIAAKLCLQPGQKVLDIGCGWGGLALYLNKVADVDVLGITLSEEQFAVATRRAAEAGVADRVKFKLIDYRALEGKFDRVVSVGMFEHVGRPNYRRFFEVVRDRMTEDGVALIHTIGRADGPGVTDPWTRKYIFPGGYSPALSEVLPAIEKSWLWATDVEVLRLHYAYTLEHWYVRAQAARDKIVALYDERFYRMWMFYLGGAITAFRNDGHCNFQIQLARKRDAVPLTRDYIGEAEALYRAKTGAESVFA